MSTATLAQEQKQLPPRLGPVMDGKAGIVRLENGTFLVGEDDDFLDKPVVYYNAHHPNKAFRLVPGQYPLPHFERGRFVCRTKYQEKMVRDILKGSADRWRGDTPAIDEDMTCPNHACGLVTRNFHVFQDHLKYSGHNTGD
jgi:hypothetical protein